VNKYANVSFKEDTIPQVQKIDLRALIVPKEDTTFPIKSYPTFLDFSVRQSEKPREQKLTLRDLDVLEYKISVVDYPHEFFKVKADKKLKPGKTAEIKLKPIKEFPAEGFKKVLTIDLQGKENTRVTVPVIYAVGAPPASAPKK
jgi:hypothetical protein